MYTKTIIIDISIYNHSYTPSIVMHHDWFLFNFLDKLNLSKIDFFFQNNKKIVSHHI